MSKKLLIVTDSIFAASIVMIAYSTDGFTRNKLGLFLIILVALLNSLTQHVNYYKRTKRIY